MTTNTYPIIPITADIEVAFGEGRCDDASHGKPMTHICEHANKCIVVKRVSHRWAVVHDEDGGFNDIDIPLVSWHLSSEAPANMGKLACADTAVAGLEMDKLKAVAALIRERTSDLGNEAEMLTPTASQDSEMSIPPVDLEIQLAAQRALKAMAPRKTEKEPRAESSGMDDDEDWEFVDVEPINKGWIWILSEEERKKAKRTRDAQAMAKEMK